MMIPIYVTAYYQSTYFGCLDLCHWPNEITWSCHAYSITDGIAYDNIDIYGKCGLLHPLTHLKPYTHHTPHLGHLPEYSIQGMMKHYVSMINSNHRDPVTILSQSQMCLSLLRIYVHCVSYYHSKARQHWPFSAFWAFGFHCQTIN